MAGRLLDTLGIFLYPQMAISVIVIGLCIAYLLAAARGELRNQSSSPWRRQLDPLGGIAVSVGLLGSVWAFTTAFGGFSGGIDVDRIVEGLGTAYTTTGVGLVTAIIAGLGSYVCDLLAQRG
ncbi:MAG: MotA/TolQ/ExbB proton channel family protein [Planctomycetota bacterium]|jgi:hypothetical protein